MNYNKSLFFICQSLKLPLYSDNLQKTRNGLEKKLIESANVNFPKHVLSHIHYILQTEQPKSLVNSNLLPKNKYSCSLWKGDITTLRVHAIVNAANKYGVGCFVYGHKCIDNIIHQKAGPLLRTECSELMKHKKIISTGDAIVTKGYMLPCKYIIHVVGPIYNEDNNPIQNLKKCYIACLNKCRKNNCHSIAFCCISTGIFGFPKKIASKIAVQTVYEWIQKNNYFIHVIFCVYSDIDHHIYANEIL